MQAYPIPRKVKIVYFSGTGGTKRVAEQLAAGFDERHITASTIALDGKELFDNEKADMLMIVFPVYALNAPKPIDEYIGKLAAVNQVPAAVISVSGGGEVCPNTACRRHTIKCLMEKGYHVVYETMLVMPSNIFMKISDDLAVILLKILPDKIDKIVSDIFAGKILRTKPLFIDRILSVFAEVEKQGSKWFGIRIMLNENCTGCGLCVQHCPAGNIMIKEGRPVFGVDCLICLKCIYDCPNKALAPGIGKFIVLKDGYSLDFIEQCLADDQSGEINEAKIMSLTKGYAYSGIRKYLL